MASSTHILLLLLAVCLAHTCLECRAMPSQANAKQGLTQPKQSLQECLQVANIEVVTPDNPEYEKARRTLSKFSNNYPVAVVYPANTEQVQAAIKCAKAAHVRVLPRGGNHGNEGESVETGAITLDMQKMSRVQVAADHNSAWVEAGAQMGKLIAVLIQETNMTRGFPGGVRPTVGITGYVLGGGFGSFTRYAGLGADQLIAIKGVDANGEVVVADKDNNPELLWASRGAGGGKFVVVTDLHLRLMDVSTGITSFSYVVPVAQGVDAMMFYQKWAPTLPDIITHRAGIRPDRDGKKSYLIGGRYMGSIEDAKTALIATGLHDSGMLHVDNFTFVHSNYLKTVEDNMGFTMPPGPDKFTVLSERKYWEFEYAWAYKFRSLIADSFPREFFETALEFGQFSGSEVEFQALTGAVSRVPKDAAASGHLRTGNFLVAMRGAKEPKNNRVGSDSGEQLPERVTACPGNSFEVMQGNVNASLYIQKLGSMLPEVKAYINFRDTGLPNWAPDYLTAYYGDQLPALECVKAKYDSADFFHLPMDLQPSTRSAAECAELLKKVGAAAADFSRYLLTAGPAKSDPPSSVTQPSTATPTLANDASRPIRVSQAVGRKSMAGRKLR